MSLGQVLREGADPAQAAKVKRSQLDASVAALGTEQNPTTFINENNVCEIELGAIYIISASASSPVVTFLQVMTTVAPFFARSRATYIFCTFYFYKN